MTEYRIFFLDRRGAIEARQELFAEDDDAAIALSTIVFQACSEVYGGFELWSFARQVMAVTSGRGKLAEIRLDEITSAMQQSVLNFEDSIHRSHLRVARSKKLLDATETLRDVLARREPAPGQPL
jgi:hypothetical protein